MSKKKRYIVSIHHTGGSFWEAVDGDYYVVWLTEEEYAELDRDFYGDCSKNTSVNVVEFPGSVSFEELKKTLKQRCK